MPRAYRFGGLVAAIILALVICPQILDLEPFHWAYGQFGCLAGALARRPRILRLGRQLPADCLTEEIAVFSPRRVRRYPAGSPGFCLRLITETGRDCLEGAKTVVDTTRADCARAMKPARKQVHRLSTSGVIRIVIWDGAHHLPSLPLDPDILVVPVLPDSGGNIWICHGTMADAVPVEDLLQAMDRLKCSGWVVAVPRLGTMAKADLSLEYLAKAAIEEIEGLHGLGPGKRTVKGRFLADGAFLSGDGTLVWGPSAPKKEAASALLNYAVKAGAVRVLCPAESADTYQWLRRRCRAEGLAFNRFGYPLGVRHILMSLLLGRDLKKAAEDRPRPTEEQHLADRLAHEP